ncbi:MAG: T9SS type A sorting domain-containing protein [Saprospiraceae bacterium]|nr:T9SS type A sorting domain-containing protein [Saprospiraceae bacterium]MCF8249887.1 T9SS type A sorting domain-containing protein [Saprospiraceae bacterium]MCF8279300.1 T9SS type A sorting domain-containing protein [Bacteroidales bacterium]MCF8309991.1 T9SS type A sorting domain-containing protein [Saprospiraceae bacterium]MCF8438891.1 T9SS type A sorting domain-containing protein [Saprospiraceae bacterium]
MKKETTTILLFSILSYGILANNVANPFWQESFNGSFPTAWSIGDASGQGVLWEWCDNPNDCPPATLANLACSDAEFRSTGFDDGYMFVNSFANGPLPISSQSYLRTEFIDCSDKAAVFIQFQTYIHAVYNDPTTNAVIRVRSGNDPWMTFTVFPYLNSAMMGTLQSWNAQPVLIDISAAAANKPNITIEWNWTAKFDIAWMIDDVALFDSNPLYNNAVWGQNAFQGDFAGGLNGWTVTQQLDTCRWRWINSGLMYLPVGGAEADYYACWPGAANGAMLMNAAPCNLFSPSTPYSRSDLRSPIINLSNIPAGTKLDLKYNQAFAVANRATVQLPITSVVISIDNGASFIDTIDVNPLQPFLHGKCEAVSFRLPNAVAGKSQVRLQFIFSGDTHFWLVDDVRIAYANDQDLAINPGFFSVAPDFSQPKNQLRPISLFTQVRNEGNSSMDNVVVYAEVRNSLNNIVFIDSVSLGLVDPSDDWEDVFFPDKFLPAPQVADYQVFYRIKSSTSDQNLTNNNVHWEYEVTEGVFAKNKFCFSSNGYFFPSESVDYEIGNCYYVPNGSGLKAKSVSFAYKNNARLDDANAQLSINLYQWKNGDNIGDVNSDTIANLNEYELIAYNIYDADSDDNNMVVTVPVSGEMDSVDLKDDTYYFVTVGYLDPVAVNGVIQRFPIAGSEEINYTAMFYNSYEDGIPAYTSMLREGDDVDFRANAWALRRIPFINLNVVQYVSSTDQLLNNPKEITIWPNPANETIKLTCDFVSYNHPIQVEIFDLCGGLALRKEFENGIVSQLPIDVSRLSNGSYTLRVICGANTVSTKLVVVH